jgi:hypothetical protein
VTNGEQQGPVELQLTTPAGPRTISTDAGRVLKLDDGDEAVVARWPDDTGVLARDTLSKASMMTVSFQGKWIGSFTLPSTSRALNSLFLCASGLGSY